MAELKKALPDKYFRELSQKLASEWEHLASELDFERSDIHRFKVDETGVANQIFAMLVAWRQRQKGSVHQARHVFLTALKTVNRNDLAAQLQDRTAVALPRGPVVDAQDSACGGVQITANFPDPSTVPRQQQPQQMSYTFDQKPEEATTYTYEAPAGTVPYVGKLTISGTNSPVIIGSVSNSTFNFGGGSKRK